MSSPTISFIIPTFNVASKINRCFESLDAMQAELPSIEAIFIDDCSTDRTVELIKKYQDDRQWVMLHTLTVNSGSPSRPRNIGLKLASGEYVFHLDPDDELLPKGVLTELDKAASTNADVVRAPLIRDDGRTRKIMNDLPGWSDIETQREKIALMVRRHSTTVCGLYRRKYLIANDIQWPEGQWMGEDAVYLYTLVSHGKTEYTAEPDFVYHVSKVAGVSSSTQKYGDAELGNHTVVWAKSSTILERIGVDYFSTRGQVALQSVITSMIRVNRGGFSRNSWNKFRDLLLKYETTIRRYQYSSRYAQIRDCILDGDYNKFHQLIKLRLLIAGYDLKFITPIVPALQDHYQVQIDEWTGHNIHDVEKSKRLLGWADLVHCEWLLGNSVWYSRHIKPEQRLITRMHRFELTRDFGHSIDREKTDRIISIAPATMEQMQQRFAFDREKIRYIPNAVDIDSFRQSDDPSKVFRLAMVGILPSLKGYHRALQLLHELRQIDDRYTLTVFGKRPDELTWIANDTSERKYYKQCDRFARETGIESAVAYSGWVKTSEHLGNYGFILSLSDLEGSHQAVAEGYAAGSISLILPWAGAKYLYPERFIMPDIFEMRDYILQCRDYNQYSERARGARDFVRERFSIGSFLRLYNSLVDDIL